MWKLTLYKKGTANLSGEKHYFPEFTATRKGLLQQSLHCLSVLLYNVTCIQRSHMQLTGILVINWTGQVHPGPPLATPLPVDIAEVYLQNKSCGKLLSASMTISLM